MICDLTCYPNGSDGKLNVTEITSLLLEGGIIEIDTANKEAIVKGVLLLLNKLGGEGDVVCENYINGITNIWLDAGEG